MKTFLLSFSICLVISYIFLFYFGNILIENSWAALLLAAVISLVMLILLFRQQKEVSELEKELGELKENTRIRLEALEKANTKGSSATQPTDERPTREQIIEERANSIRPKS